jgi:hypothetical protein
MSYKKFNREDGASFHPKLIENYRSKHKLSTPDNIAKTKYGHLSDKSTYAEYAWEFLRRNKFYQGLIDSWDDEIEYENNPYPIEHWGYKQTPKWEPHCGLFESETKEGKRLPYKHYSSKYVAGLAWFPIEYIKLTMSGGIGITRPLEDKKTQMHLAFDLGHVFGPNSTGLRKQLDLAHAELTKQLSAVKERMNGSSNEFTFGRDEMTPTQKGVLRRYLYVADLLTPKLKVKKDLTSEPTRLPMLKQIAADIGKELGTANSTDSIGKDANHAFDMIYKWHCLGLVSLIDNEKSTNEE